VTALTVLATIAVAQGCFLLLLLVFLAERRRHGRLHRARLAAAREGLAVPLREWLAMDGGAEPVIVALRRLPVPVVVGYVSLLVRSVVPIERRGELSILLRDEGWMSRALAGARSRFWWRRIEAARALSLVGEPSDRPVVQRLLEDRQAEVAIAAVACLPRVADADLINRELDRYAMLTPMLRQYLLATLREMQELVDPLLAARLRPDAEPIALSERVRLAATLEFPRALRAAVPLATHVSAAVRAAVAIALGRMPNEASFRSLGMLLRDSDAAVREAATASLGALASPAAVPMLAAAMRDSNWHVRRRAGLALAQLGDAGRAVVDALRTDPDPYVASMATLASGLTEGALLELTEN
jgi:HEAT repeat protein